jgi:cation diffusion facilitator family transporter
MTQESTPSVGPRKPIPIKNTPTDGATSRLLGWCAFQEILVVSGNLTAAIVASSLTLYAESAKEAVETLATLGVWLMLRRMQNRRHEFDFGLGRIESLLTIALEVVLFFTGCAILIEAYERFQEPHTLNSIGFAVTITVVGFISGFIMYRALAKEQAQRPSPMLKSKMLTYRIAMVGDFGIIATLVAAKLFPGQAWALYLDPLVACCFGIALLVKVYGSLSHVVGDLSDKTLEETSQLVVVRELAVFFHDYEQIHGIRSRRSGNVVYLEIFLEFRQDLPFGAVQETMDRIRARLEEHLGNSRVLIIPARCAPE